MSQPHEPKGAGASPASGASATDPGLTRLRNLFGGGGNTPAPPRPAEDEDDEDDEGMLRMSFLEHLEELRSRIIKIILGVVGGLVISFSFVSPLWHFIVRPATTALKDLGVNPPTLAQLSPMEAFNVIWFKMPLVCAIFIASPWVVYQIWAFISPGLYKKERRWAVPFILGTAGLFILGGVFGYFVVFRFGLTFLLGIGKGNDVTPVVSVTEYFDMFVNVILGVGAVFELPVIIFFLILFRIVTPGFLIRHSRYAILIIFIIAAIVTPTPDVFNLSLFALPMCILYFMGVFLGYLFVLRREGQRFPWHVVFKITLILVLVLTGVMYVAVTRYGYKLVPHWPFLIR